MKLRGWSPIYDSRQKFSTQNHGVLSPFFFRIPTHPKISTKYTAGNHLLFSSRLDFFVFSDENLWDFFWTVDKSWELSKGLNSNWQLKLENLFDKDDQCNMIARSQKFLFLVRFGVKLGLRHRRKLIIIYTMVISTCVCRKPSWTPKQTQTATTLSPWVRFGVFTRLASTEKSEKKTPPNTFLYVKTLGFLYFWQKKGRGWGFFLG